MKIAEDLKVQVIYVDMFHRRWMKNCHHLGIKFSGLYEKGEKELPDSSVIKSVNTKHDNHHRPEAGGHFALVCTGCRMGNRDESRSTTLVSAKYWASKPSHQFGCALGITLAVVRIRKAKCKLPVYQRAAFEIHRHAHRRRHLGHGQLRASNDNLEISLRVSGEEINALTSVAPVEAPSDISSPIRQSSFTMTSSAHHRPAPSAVRLSGSLARSRGSKSLEPTRMCS